VEEVGVDVPLLLIGDVEIRFRRVAGGVIRDRAQLVRAIAQLRRRKMQLNGAL